MLSVTVTRSQNLRDTNRRLRFWLDSMPTRQRKLAAATPGHVTPERMAGLLSELLRAGVGLRAEPLPAKGTDPEWDRELDEYRGNVERLRNLLPSIHRDLLAERARLECQRTRVRSAAEWARASRQTL
jgi:hypothetical protein